jgi:hypothetical protein
LARATRALRRPSRIADPAAGRLHGEPVPVYFTVVVDFTLE